MAAKLLKDKTDELFEKRLFEEIQRLVKERKSTILKPGLKLRRHPLDELEEKGIIDSGKLGKEFQKILEKKTNLSASLRSTILLTGIKILRKINEDTSSNL